MDYKLSGAQGQGLYLLLINTATVIFMVIWGAYERLSAIKRGKVSEGGRDMDSKSLKIFYASILIGYFGGIPIAFSSWGTISAFFPWFQIAGFIVIAGGLYIRQKAIQKLSEQFTYTVRIIEKHRLITDGVYRYIRHPSYLGQAMIFLGCGMAFSNYISLFLLFVPSLLAAFYRISVEEKALVSHFSSEYRDYIRRTRRLIPGIF